MSTVDLVIAKMEELATAESVLGDGRALRVVQRYCPLIRKAFAQHSDHFPRPKEGILMNEPTQKASRFNPDGEVVHDLTTNLTWTTKDAIDKDVTHEEAIAAVAELNAAKFAGFDDWRLPTVEELFLLVDRSRVSPAIDTDAFPTTKNDWYWSSTLDRKSPSDYAWFVNFNGGNSDDGSREFHVRVRAVRGPARQ